MSHSVVAIISNYQSLAACAHAVHSDIPMATEYWLPQPCGVALVITHHTLTAKEKVVGILSGKGMGVHFGGSLNLFKYGKGIEAGKIFEVTKGIIDPNNISLLVNAVVRTHP